MADIAGRLDWWRIKDEHTPFEWACQVARSIVEPWGDERDDLRAAWNTLKLMQFGEKPTDEELAGILDNLRFYLKSNVPPPVEETPEQTRRRLS